VTGASPQTVTRIVCYCDDCQAFLHHLGRSELMDSQGGSDIVQIAPASLTFRRGTEQIAAVRLNPKGMFRWYATCCKTPLGNTLMPAVPFIGVLAPAFASANLDDTIGKPLCGILGKFAIGEPPEGSTKMHLGFLARAFRAILGWKLSGRTWPHPYFDRATRAPAFPVTVLSSAEREALRPLCGPREATTTA
jgi:hypothetical protein